MRSALIFLVLALVCVPNAGIQAQETEEVEYSIFEYQGVDMRDGSFGLLKFSVFWKENDRVNVKMFYVWPENIEIKVRKDSEGVTTLKTSVAYKSRITENIVIDRAMLLVPTAEDVAAWQKHFYEAKRKARIAGPIKSVEIKFSGEKFYVSFKTETKVNFSKISDRLHALFRDYIIKEVLIAADKIDSVTVHFGKNDPQNPRFVAYRPLFKVISDQEFRLEVDELWIIVSDDVQQKEWNEKLRVLKEKTQPHRVLPPKD